MKSLFVIGAVMMGSLVVGCDDSPPDKGGQGGSAGGGQGGGGGSGGDTTPMIETAGDKLYAYLTGHFDSTTQAKSDSNYLPINLQTCPIDIPELGTRLLHVEQAVIQNGQVQAPYRQRVYVVTDGADPMTQAISNVWEFNTPGPFAGFCGGTGDKATVADLVERDGCRVELTWMTDHFEGSTPGKECLSNFQGATYATSKVSVFDNRISSWDQGWDANDKQVWGAVKGPYVFDRLSPLPGPQP